MATIGGLNTGSGQTNYVKPQPSNPSVKHDVGQIFGHVLNALPGHSTLGENITNPAVNYKGIANPGYTTKQAPANTGQSGGGTDNHVLGYGTTISAAQAAADAAARAANDAAYNTYGTQAHTALNDLLGQYNTQKDSLASQYGIKGHELQSGFNSAQNTYNNNVLDQNQNQLRQDNQIQQGVSHAYQNLMNLLGAYGAGGGSVAQQWAPGAAQRYAATQLGQADQNTASNLRSLNTGWGTYQDQFDQQKKQLADSQAQDTAQATKDYNTTRSRLNDILTSIGNQSLPAADLGSEISSIRSSIPNNVFVKPSYTGTTPVYNAPNLSTFEANIPAANLSTFSNSAASTPALAYLLGQQQKQHQQQPA